MAYGQKGLQQVLVCENQHSESAPELAQAKMDEFLQQCKQSGDAAYAAFRSVLERLDDPNTRSQARIFLSDLQKRFPTKDDCDQCFRTYHFRIEDVLLDQIEGTPLVCSFSAPLPQPTKSPKVTTSFWIGLDFTLTRFLSHSPCAFGIFTL